VGQFIPQLKLLKFKIIMTSYTSASGKSSGVTAYEIGDDYIKVKFGYSKTCKYPYSLNDEGIIDTMKELALASSGLSSFIARNKGTLKFT
jgi:hypothetical protein